MSDIIDKIEKSRNNESYYRELGREMKEIKDRAALFFDIDGTLWNYDHYIPESTFQAVRAARKNGHYALICSGRSRSFVDDPELLSIGFDGLVCACGCHIEIGGRVVSEYLIDEDRARETIEMVRNYGLKPILEGPEFSYMDEVDFPVGDLFGDILRRDMGKKLLPIGGEQYGKWRINKFSTEATDTEAAELCYRKLEKDFQVIRHDERVSEVVPAGFDKAGGMLKACELLGIDPQNTYAFGDSENDLLMLKAAGHGIAMGNGTERAKQAADYVTSPFDADGIFLAMEHYGLI